MEKARGAEQANGVREYTMLQFGFEFPRQLEQGRQFLEQMASANTGLGDFLLRRSNRNVEAVTRMMQCKSLPEVFLLQAQWMRDATDDYMKEAARMSEVHARMFGSSWGPKGMDSFFSAARANRPSASARETV